MLRLGTTLLALFRPRDLEHIPENRYRRLIFQALVRRGDAAWVIPVGVGLAAAIAWNAVGVAIAAVLARPGVATNWSRLGMVNALVGLIVLGLVASYVRWRMVTASIRRILNKAVCPFCDFSLLGLKPDLGAVVCPECGERLVLSEIGLDADDLDLAPNTPFETAGSLGAYTGQLPAEQKIRPLRRGGGSGA